MSQLAVRTRGLVKSYGAVKALQGVELDIQRGECVAMLGPNGAGKTTTTEILEGFRERDGGEVSVLGVDPRHGDRAWKSRLGIVLQTAGDLRDLKVVESVAHFAKYFANAADPEQVIAAVGLAEKRTARVSALSGGQRRRLDVALGIIGNPELLFLDEPTTGFDPEARRQFWTLVESLKAKEVTILLTTHYLEEAEVLADRVAVIANGRVVADQTPAALRAEATRQARVTWLEQGEAKSVETPTPTEVVRQLLSRLDGEVEGLTVTRPSLEDVYLQLVGTNGTEVAQ